MSALRAMSVQRMAKIFKAQKGLGLGQSFARALDKMGEKHPESLRYFLKAFFHNRVNKEIVVGACGCCGDDVCFKLNKGQLDYACKNHKCENHSG